MESIETDDLGTGGRGGIQVIARAAALLRALEGQAEGLSLGAIARAIDLPRSTVQRLVAALEAEGLVETGPGGTRLGPAILRLASGVHGDLAAVARPHLEQLAKDTEETVCLIHGQGTALSIVHAIVSSQELRVAPMPENLLQIHTTSAGKVLLAALPDDSVGTLLPASLPRLTAHTLSDRAALFAELAQVRQEGFAYDREEHVTGVCAVATRLHAPGGLYALCVLAPSFRFEPALDRLRAGLIACRQAIERSCGL
ncbi:IclR family transcriptional regulator [Stutzerimonas azotifigens]|uniref:IclR family transcriptional regulator n=1 Tax=Stutzerimonas azotifigens TaxID=291995 RepID=UPI000425BAA0|nr:IclR family transcriptional regulator [Stutzerimonas azotifigens]